MTAKQEIRLRYLYSPSGDANHPDEEVLSVYREHGVIPKSSRSDNFNKTPENVERYLLVRPGDLVVNRMKAWQGALGVSDYQGIVSGDYEVLRPASDSVSGRYMHYALRSRHMVGEYRVRSTGIRPSQWRLYWDQMGDIRISLPPMEEQERIAAYLDRETAQTDTLITEQQQLVEMLRERRRAVVTFTFSEHEPNSRLEAACLDIVDCPHTTPDADDNGSYEAVRTASVRDGRYRPGLGIPVSKDTWLERNRGGVPEVGDVLLTREAPAGEACMVPEEPDVCLGQRMVLLKTNPERTFGDFLVWQIYADPVKEFFISTANGSTVSNLRLPVIRKTPIWLPSLVEQQQIAASLAEQIARIDTLIAESERLIELSQERRAALITAAVTGQIKV